MSDEELINTNINQLVEKHSHGNWLVVGDELFTQAKLWKDKHFKKAQVLQLMEEKGWMLIAMSEGQYCPLRLVFRKIDDDEE